ncbi:MAG: ABC transporter substrate-binding protein [Desulfobacterales bacterium]|nr:ABC transporter substrate-binding protein [Desulfobacterales bacterium]
MKKIIFIIILINFLITNVPADTMPKTGGTIIYGFTGQIAAFDPIKSNDIETIAVMSAIYETLVRYKDDFTDIEPGLATSWNVSKDAKEWIFYLRKGVYFHDGTPFNADSVIFSFSRQTIDKKGVTKIEAIDDYTLKFFLEEPYAPFLYGLSSTLAYIVSPTAVQKWGNEFGNHPVGTGAFKFKDWKQGDPVVLEKNTSYWDTPPYVEKVVYQPFTNNKDLLIALKTAAVHVMGSVDPQDIVTIERDENLKIAYKPGINISYLAMNTEKKPFDNVKVRQAINYAINKKKLVKFLFQGLAIPAVTPIPPLLWGNNKNIVDYDYNPQKAKELLKEAGYPNGFETTLWQMPVPRPYNPQPEKIAEIFKASLADVGIKAEIISSYDWKTYLAKGKLGEHEMAFFGWVPDYPDPDQFLYKLLDKDNAVKKIARNRAFYKNEQVHELLIKARQILDIKERSRLYYEAQKIIHDDAPWVPIAHVQQFLAFRKNIHDIIVDPRGTHKFYKAWIE